MTSQDGNDEEINDIEDGEDQRGLDDILSTQANKGSLRSKIKKKHIQYAAAVGVILFILLCVVSCQPKKGGNVYGICSTFLELNVQYPMTLRYLDTEMSRTAVRIYFTQIDPFGQLKQEMIECKFGPDKNGFLKLTQIDRNRSRVDQAVVDKFNQTLPAVMAGKPYLVLPPEWKNPLLKD